jgi:hypothetical protein
LAAFHQKVPKCAKICVHEEADANVIHPLIGATKLAALPFMLCFFPMFNHFRKKFSVNLEGKILLQF